MKTGGVISAVHVTVLAAVDVLVHASIANQDRVCERLHPLLTTGPSLGVIVVMLRHASLAVAVPNAALISDASGLHPSDVDVPPVVITGGVTSSIQLADLDAVEVLPQSSIASHVLICERWHPPLVMAPSLTLNVGTPHASVAVAVPNALLISLGAGLQPRNPPMPPVVIVGGSRSSTHVTVLDTVDVLLQASFAVKVRVCERPHPVLVIDPSLGVIVGVLTASVAVAVPSAGFISLAEGLQPSVNVVPPTAVIVGGATSNDNVAACEITEGLHAPLTTTS